MTLPFADKPDQSSIYQDLKTLSLQDLTPEQFDAFRQRMLSQGTDGLEDEYRRLVLLGLASDKVSLAGPIPKAMKIETQTWTATGTKAWAEPNPGEVWEVLAAQGQITGGTGSTTFYLAVRDSATAVQVRLSDGESISSGLRTIEPNGVLSSLYLTEGFEMVAYVNPFNATQLDISVLMARIR